MSKIGQVHPYSQSIERTASVGRGASAPHHLEVSAIAFSDSLARLPAGSLPT